MLLGVGSLYFKTRQSANLHDVAFWAEPALGTATVWLCIRTGARWWKRIACPEPLPARSRKNVEVHARSCSALSSRAQRRIQPFTRLRSCRSRCGRERHLLLLTASRARNAVLLRKPEKGDRRQAWRSAKLMRDHRNRCPLSTSELWTSATSSSPTTSCSGGALLETPRDLAQKVAVGKLCEDCLQ